MIQSVNVLGVKIHAVASKEVLGLVEKYVREKKKKMVFTPNPEMIVEAGKNVEFMKVLNKADLAIPDGVGIVWASYMLSLRSRFMPMIIIQAFFSLLSLVFYPKFCRKIIKERVTGTDMFEDINYMAEKKRYKIFLLGASTGIARKAKEKLNVCFPDLHITGVFAGSPEKKNELSIISRINRVSPDILFVAYGAPAQEMWIFRNLSRLSTVKVAMGVGGAFDFVSGKIRRAPKVLRILGLEWMFRLVVQPYRIKRIWNATVRFVIMVIIARKK